MSRRSSKNTEQYIEVLKERHGQLQRDLVDLKDAFSFHVSFNTATPARIHITEERAVQFIKHAMAAVLDYEITHLKERIQKL